MSQHEVRLLEQPLLARQLPLPYGTPIRAEEAAGWEVEEPTLQYHTGRASHALGGSSDRALYHTHGAGKDDRLVDLTKFVRDLDAGLWPTITHKGSPIVLMTSEKLDQVFRRMTRLTSIVSPTIFGSFDRATLEDLHDLALELVGPAFDED
jgi:hypothetical protein